MQSTLALCAATACRVLIRSCRAPLLHGHSAGAHCCLDRSVCTAMSDQDITKEGPYVWTVVHGNTVCQRTSPCGKVTRPVHVPIVVTTPAAATVTSNVPPAPYPICVLFNGFQARASQYTPYAQRLASWGFLVVQYNAPAFTIIPDAEEMPFLAAVLRWLRHSSGADSSDGDEPCAYPALQGRPDFERCVLAGHSRGGKLAALHFSNPAPAAGLPSFKAAFLLDPVNNTERTPVSPSYPDAAAALSTAGKPFGMAGAGLIGPANPEGSNWKQFDRVAPASSWRLVLPSAGHTTFISPPAAWERWLMDTCFGGGPMPRDRLTSLTTATMMAWFWSQLAAAEGKHAQQRASLAPAAQAHSGAGLEGGGGGHHGVVEDNPLLQPVPLVATMAQPVAAAAVATAAADAGKQAAAEQLRHSDWGAQLAASFLQKLGLKAGATEVQGTDFDLVVKV